MGYEMPLVSVIIPTYNREHLIIRSLKSAISQTYTNIEIIVVDDGSNDGTENIVCSIEDSRIFYLKHEINKGANIARNTGISISKGKYIAFLDSDDEWFPNKLEIQVAVFLKCSNPKIGVVYSGFYKSENEIKQYIPPISSQKEGNIHKDLLRGNFIITPSVLIKKECFDRVGLFDEHFCRLEDWELWIRISKHYDFKFINLPLGIAHYRSKKLLDDHLSNDEHKILTAMELLLVKYSSDFYSDKDLLANFYSSMGKKFYFVGDSKWKDYYLMSIKANPFNFKLLLSIFVSLFGSKLYGKFTSFYSKISDLSMKCRIFEFV